MGNVEPKRVIISNSVFNGTMYISYVILFFFFKGSQ